MKTIFTALVILAAGIQTAVYEVRLTNLRRDNIRLESEILDLFALQKSSTVNQELLSQRIGNVENATAALGTNFVNHVAAEVVASLVDRK